MPVIELSILFEVSHATHFHTKKDQYVFKRIYISPGDEPSAYAHLKKNVSNGIVATVM
jgi:hypothetical protein